MAAAVAAVLELPLSAVVLGVMMTSSTAPGASPLIIVGVVVAYLTIRALNQRLGDGRPATARAPDPEHDSEEVAPPARAEAVPA